MNTQSLISILLTLGLIALSIVSLIGLVYLTKFSFSSKKSNVDRFTVEMTDTERQLSQVTVVLAWIQISIPLFIALLAVIYFGLNINSRSLSLQMPVVFV